MPIILWTERKFPPQRSMTFPEGLRIMRALCAAGYDVRLTAPTGALVVLGKETLLCRSPSGMVPFPPRLSDMDGSARWGIQFRRRSPCGPWRGTADAREEIRKLGIRNEE